MFTPVRSTFWAPVVDEASEVVVGVGVVVKLSLSIGDAFLPVFLTTFITILLHTAVIASD